MAYVRKTTTLVLFFLLVVSITIFTLSTTFYQKSLTKLNDIIQEKNNKIEKLSSIISDLNKNLTTLNEILDIQLKREENLSEQYITLKLKKDTLEKEKLNLESELNTTLDELFDEKIKVENLELEINQLILNLTEMNKTIDNLIDDLEDICNQVVSLNISDCEKYN